MCEEPKIICEACFSDKIDLLGPECEHCGQEYSPTTLNLSGWRELSRVENKNKKKISVKEGNFLS